MAQKTKRELRAIVNGGRKALRVLMRAHAELNAQITIIADMINSAKNELNARGLPVPRLPGRPRATTLPAEVVQHVANRAAAATQGFDEKPKKKLSKAQRAALDRAHQARRRNAAARREAAEKAAHA